MILQMMRGTNADGRTEASHLHKTAQGVTAERWIPFIFDEAYFVKRNMKRLANERESGGVENLSEF